MEAALVSDNLGETRLLGAHSQMPEWGRLSQEHQQPGLFLDASCNVFKEQSSSIVLFFLYVNVGQLEICVAKRGGGR